MKNNLRKALVEKKSEIINRTFKNIGHLCETLGIDEVPTNRTNFMKVFSQYYIYEKKGHKILVQEYNETVPFFNKEHKADYIRMAEMFYSLLLPLEQGDTVYYTNAQIATHFGLLTNSHYTLKWKIKGELLKKILGDIIAKDYSITVNQLIQQRIQSLAKKDHLNVITQVWACDGEELTQEERNYFLKELENRKKEKYNQELTFGELTDIMNTLPHDSNQQVLKEINDERIKQKKPIYYKTWKIEYNGIPFQIKNKVNCLKETRLGKLEPKAIGDCETTNMVYHYFVNWLETGEFDFDELCECLGSDVSGLVE